jgi:hypothetical protein
VFVAEIAQVYMRVPPATRAEYAGGLYCVPH